MDLAPIRILLNQDLIQALRENRGKPEQKLGEYLHHMRLFDQATTDNEMSNDKRFSDLDAVIGYFNTLKGLTSGLVSQLTTTVKSLKTLWLLSESDTFQFRVSVLGTIVVENYFSTVRSKCRYPNLWGVRRVQPLGFL